MGTRCTELYVFVAKHIDLINRFVICLLKADVSVKIYCISFVMFVMKTRGSVAYFVKEIGCLIRVNDRSQ